MQLNACANRLGKGTFARLDFTEYVLRTLKKLEFSNPWLECYVGSTKDKGVCIQ